MLRGCADGCQQRFCFFYSEEDLLSVFQVQKGIVPGFDFPFKPLRASIINEYSKCVGVNGKVDYDIFKPLDDGGNEFLRIIDIKLSRTDKDIKLVHFQIQANIETGYVNEVPSYFGIDGESQSLFGGVFAMMGFCDTNLESLF